MRRPRDALGQGLERHDGGATPYYIARAREASIAILIEVGGGGSSWPGQAPPVPPAMGAPPLLQTPLSNYARLFRLYLAKVHTS